MVYKCIGIGNRMMGDDSIGILAAEALKDSLEELGIQSIIAETDFNYALDQISDKDFLFILDAAYEGGKPGTISFINLEDEIKKDIIGGFAHQISLISLLRQLKKTNKGYLIGIEIAEIEFSLNLSEQLEEQFSPICQQIYGFIKEYIRGRNNA